MKNQITITASSKEKLFMLFDGNSIRILPISSVPDANADRWSINNMTNTILLPHPTQNSVPIQFRGISVPSVMQYGQSKQPICMCWCNFPACNIELGYCCQERYNQICSKKAFGRHAHCKKCKKNQYGKKKMQNWIDVNKVHIHIYIYIVTTYLFRKLG